MLRVGIIYSVLMSGVIVIWPVRSQLHRRRFWWQKNRLKGLANMYTIHLLLGEPLATRSFRSQNSEFFQKKPKLPQNWKRYITSKNSSNCTWKYYCMFFVRKCMITIRELHRLGPKTFCCSAERVRRRDQLRLPWNSASRIWHADLSTGPCHIRRTPFKHDRRERTGYWCSLVEKITTCKKQM